MSLVDDTAPDEAAAARDRLRHDLISPLTIISGRSQLLARMLQRSSSLTEAERSTMLGGLATYRGGRAQPGDPDRCLRA